jgi:hypothetical protein
MRFLCFTQPPTLYLSGMALDFSTQGTGCGVNLKALAEDAIGSDSRRVVVVCGAGTM